MGADTDASSPDPGAAPADLRAHIAARIRQGGPMTVAEYMATCLGHPDLGYYTAGDPLGAGGDFITAPEITQVFGELLGLWAAEAWTRLGRPPRVAMVELGPGRGTLLRDALRATRQAMPGFPAAAELHLVETSPILAAHQASTLADAAPTWHSDLATLPTDVPLLVLANELFDALPIHQLEMRDSQWRERLIDLDEPDETGEPTLRRVLGRHAGTAAPLIPAWADRADDGAVLEVPVAGRNLARTLGERLAVQGGAGLIIDYGPAEIRLGESLQAVHAHRYADPLAEPGRADLSAHVAFPWLAAGAREGGAQTLGPVTQGTFLLRLGLQERGNALLGQLADQPEAARSVYDGCRRLVESDQMGALFKVLALSDGRITPDGFATG